MKSKKRVYEGYVSKELKELFYESSSKYIPMPISIIKKKNYFASKKIKVTVEELPCKTK